MTAVKSAWWLLVTWRQVISNHRDGEGRSAKTNSVIIQYDYENEFDMLVSGMIYASFSCNKKEH